MADLEDGRTPGLEALSRIAGWGTATAVALGALIFTAQSDTGSRRLQLALESPLAEDTPVAVAALAKPDPALKLLQARLDRLDGERMRIDARLTTLEHGLEDMTGSIRRQSERQPAAPRPFIELPVIPKVETLPAASGPEAMSVASDPTPGPAPEPAAEATSEPVPVTVPFPRPRPPPRRHSHAEYGVELGTARDTEALRARWLAIKANFGPLLVGLSPVGVKDHRPGAAQLRLVAGPVKTLSAARELCARFEAAKGYCWPMRIDATDIVMR